MPLNQDYVSSTIIKYCSTFAFFCLSMGHISAKDVSGQTSIHLRDSKGDSEIT